MGSNEKCSRYRYVCWLRLSNLYDKCLTQFYLNLFWMIDDQCSARANCAYMQVHLIIWVNWSQISRGWFNKIIANISNYVYISLNSYFRWRRSVENAAKIFFKVKTAKRNLIDFRKPYWTSLVCLELRCRRLNLNLKHVYLSCLFKPDVVLTWTFHPKYDPNYETRYCLDIYQG